MDGQAKTTRSSVRRMKLSLEKYRDIRTTTKEDTDFGIALSTAGILPYSYGSFDRIEPKESEQEMIHYRGSNGEVHELHNFREHRKIFENIGYEYDIVTTITVEQPHLSEKQEFKLSEELWPERVTLEQNNISISFQIHAYRAVEIDFYADASVLEEHNEMIENFASSVFRVFLRTCRDFGYDNETQFECATYSHATRKQECDPRFVGSILSGGEEE